MAIPTDGMPRLISSARWLTKRGHSHSIEYYVTVEMDIVDGCCTGIPIERSIRIPVKVFDRVDDNAPLPWSEPSAFATTPHSVVPPPLAVAAMGTREPFARLPVMSPQTTTPQPASFEMTSANDAPILGLDVTYAYVPPPGTAEAHMVLGTVSEPLPAAVWGTVVAPSPAAPYQAP